MCKSSLELTTHTKIIHKTMERIRNPNKNLAGEPAISEREREREFHPPLALNQTVSKQQTILSKQKP